MSEKEVAVQDRVPIKAGGQIKAIIPQTFEDCYRIGNAVVRSGLAPNGLETAEKCCIAIMHGMEIGLPPMQALQRIAVINNRPCLWGDGAMALVRGSGKCEYVKEWIEGEGDSAVAYCETRRKGEKEPVRRSFSVKEAMAAGLWGKNVWKQFPKRMLQMRPRGFCLRDVYADVLGGMYLAEELDVEVKDVTQKQDEPSAPQFSEVKPEPSRRPPPREPTRKAGEPRTDKTPYAEKAKKVEVIEADETEVEVDELRPLSNEELDDYLTELEQRFIQAPSVEDVDILFDEFADHYSDRIFPPDREKVIAMFQKAKERLA